MTKSKKENAFKETFTCNKRAWSLWWQIEPKCFLTTFLAIVVQASAPYITIYFMAQLINEIAGRRDKDTLLRLVLIILITESIMALLGEVLKRWKNAVHASIGVRKEKVLANKFLDMDFCDVDNPHTFELYSQIRQTDNWGSWGLNVVQENFEDLLKALVQIVGALVLSITLFTTKVPESAGNLLFLNHPICLTIVILVMLLATILSPVFANKSNAYWGKLSDEVTYGNRIFWFYGYVAGTERERALDIRTYGQETFFENKMKISPFLQKNSSFSVYQKGGMGLYMALSTAVAKVFIGVVYLFVCLKAWGGAFGVGSVAQYISAVTSLSAGLSLLLRTWGNMGINTQFLKENFELLDIPNNMYQGSLTVEKRSDRNYEVEFRNVSFKYPSMEEYALKNVSMKFKIGERLAVVGQNGSGKTTMIKLLCRLYDPTEGQILLNGIDIRKYNYQEYMSIFSVVFQDFQLLAFPLGENVAGKVDYDADRVKTCLTQAGFDERLAAMKNGLDTTLYKDFEKDGVEISGGEAQKIAIARALYKNAPFIVLDEPTAALDPIAEAEIYAKFNTLIQDRTAIYISHRLSSCRFCDQIAVFHEGQIVQFGSHEELVADTLGKYYELWHAQAQYYQ